MSFYYVCGGEIGLVHPGTFKKHTHTHTHSETPGWRIKCSKLTSRFSLNVGIQSLMIKLQKINVLKEKHLVHPISTVLVILY